MTCGCDFRWSRQPSASRAGNRDPESVHSPNWWSRLPVRNPVAARFLLDLLAGTNNLGGDFGRINRIDWQARDSGWLADDLVVSCSHPEGDRAAGISIKSHQQVTRNGFPAEFVEIAWRQWLGAGTERKIREGHDAVVLITGNLANEIAVAWSAMLGQALETTPERMVARLSAPDGDEGSQSSGIQRALFESFRCPETLRSHENTDTITAMRVLRHVRLLHFDYEEVTSRDDQRAVADCQRVLRLGDAADAERLWQRLIAIADEKRPLGASIHLPQLLPELRGEFDLRDHPDYQKDWEVLERHSQASKADIRTEIAGLTPLTARRRSSKHPAQPRGARRVFFGRGIRLRKIRFGQGNGARAIPARCLDHRKHAGLRHLRAIRAGHQHPSPAR